MNEPTVTMPRNKMRARVVDGLLLGVALVLLVYAVLISGGGRTIVGQLVGSRASITPATEADSSCPPCEEARRAKIKADNKKAATPKHENTPIEPSAVDSISESNG